MPASSDLFEVNGPNLDATNTFASPNNVGIKTLSDFRHKSEVCANLRRSFSDDDRDQ